MSTLLKYIILVTLITFIVSCREPFNDAPMDLQQKVLVVEGSITNIKEPYFIHLSYAMSYTNSETNNVVGANVFIQDNNGSIYDFKDAKNGNYISDSSNFVGMIGKTYTLYIKTHDGIEFKSTPCIMTPNDVKIDTIYGSNEAFLVMTGESDLLDKYETAFHLFADISFNTNQKTNSRFEVVLASPYTLYNMIYITGPKFEITKIIKNGEVIGVNRKYIGDAIVDSFQTSYNSYGLSNKNLLPVIVTNTDYTSANQLKKVPLTYIYPEAYNVGMGRGSSISYSSNWVVQLKAYSISNETFDYYYKIVKQLEGKNTLFEPMPVQLSGNITCVTDSTIPAFGLFEANAVVSKFIGFTYGTSGAKYKTDTASGWPRIFEGDTLRFEIPGTDTTVMIENKSKTKH